jgi:uncharacterized Zn-binding protein involved in type VI secretion
MPEAARETDTVDTGHGCDATTTLDASSVNTTVFVGGKLLACLGDLTVSHDIPNDDICEAHTSSISGSSESVYCSGALVARKGDACDGGTITSGASSVIIG